MTISSQVNIQMTIFFVNQFTYIIWCNRVIRFICKYQYLICQFIENFEHIKVFFKPGVLIFYAAILSRCARIDSEVFAVDPFYM